MHFNRKREKSRKKKKKRTTTNTPEGCITWRRFQWHDERSFSNKQWHHTRRWKSTDATNALTHGKHTPPAFQNLILKINLKLLKNPLIILEITNKPMWKYQNTPECIEAILKFMQSKKNSLVNVFKFH